MPTKKHPFRGIFQPYTYLLVILYIVIFTFLVSDLFTGETWNVTPSNIVLSASKAHFTKVCSKSIYFNAHRSQVKPALARARVLVQASLQPSRPITGVIMIVAFTWFLMRYPLRRFLVRITDFGMQIVNNVQLACLLTLQS